MKLLLVEDDRALAASLAKNLKAESFVVDHAYDGVEGEESALVNQYDAIILDIGLPRQDGMQTCAKLRRSGIAVPIIMLTARDDVSDKIKGLNSGADDYLTKPFSTAELIARIRALLRRPRPVVNMVIEQHGVSLDTTSRRVFRDSHEISLSVKEFALLELLMRNAGRIVTRETIMESLWDMNYDPRSNVIDAVVKLLRQKIDRGYRTSLITTVRGIGYRFAEEGR
jgi:DNA-binding response OmpR family regulator